jgi:two-component system sensor histidine kinase/response regulator
LHATRVVVLAPVGVAAPQAGQAATVCKPVKPRELFECLRGLAAPTSSSPRATSRPLLADKPSSVRGRILIAEDNPVNQRVASLQVKNLGFETDVVNNGEEALAALERLSYSLVLMDCQMPRMDGLEATRRLRRREAGIAHTPVIAMTANAFASDREACLAAGMDDFLPKPVNLKELGAVLDKWSAVEEIVGVLEG